ncbi:MAG: EFR1 family ferrodoxin [Candidatus Heimdallarchaeota archaeon]|nr:EFR1 family ferrodoxin [Candidatus Heimdallarchaeota archaeon]
MDIKITLFFFSGTGNTWWVTNKIVEKLKNQEISTSMYSIESKNVTTPNFVNEIMQASDIIGFGYPIYGSDIPEIFIEFLNHLPRSNGKKAFVYTTMLAYSGDGAMVAVRKLRKKGFKVRQAVNIRMLNNIQLPYVIFKNLKIRNGQETTPIKRKAEKKIDKLVTKIVKEKKWLEGWDPFSIMGGLMQRIPIRMMGWSFFAKYFFVDMKTCTQCMSCVDNCPTNNIRYEKDQFIFGKKCIACTRCYNLCPEDAIQHKKGTLNKQKYIRYKGPGDNFTITKLKE